MKRLGFMLALLMVATVPSAETQTSPEFKSLETSAEISIDRSVAFPVDI